MQPAISIDLTTNGKAQVADETAALLAAFLAAEGALGQAEAVLAACVAAEGQALRARAAQETAVFQLQADADQARAALRVALARARAEQR